jgi:hypothetical protein
MKLKTRSKFENVQMCKCENEIQLKKQVDFVKCKHIVKERDK